MDEWSAQVSTGAVALVAVTLVVLLAVLLAVVVVTQRRTRRELVRTRALHDEMLARLTLLERPPISQAPASTVEFVITDVGETQVEHPSASPGRVEGRLFADIVARETVVKAASWTYGLRHALSAENRNRLRFEMRRETKHSARQRKADVKEALRQYYARERGDVA